MKQFFQPEWHEQTAVFRSVSKWFVLATLIGVVVGCLTAWFLQGLTASIGWMKQYPWTVFLLPLGMVVSTYLVKTFAPQAKGHGTEKVIEAVHNNSGRIPVMVVPIKILATIVTLATGGSAGKEGPCAQIGGGLASWVSDMTRLNDADRRRLVICGVSAGFSTVFGTPVAGALFAVEVLAVGQIQYQVLFPSFVAGVSAYQVATAMGSQYFSQALQLNIPLNELKLLEVAGAGIVLGLGAFAFIELLKWLEAVGDRFERHPYWRAMLAGCFLLGTLWVSDRYLGLGLTRIEDLLQGNALADWFDPWLKMLATAVTLSFGGSGGILTPVFFIGASFGSLIGQLWSLNVGLYTTLGFVGFLSACANTPIAASVMAMEMFGAEIGVYAAMVSIIAFLITGHRSVYPTQVLQMRKSESLEVELGQPLSGVHPH